MRFRTITVLLTTTAILAACSDSSTAPTTPLEEEIEALVFESTASAADFAARADSTRRVPERDRPRLTEAQKQCIEDAVAAFRAAHKETLEALQAIHAEARAAMKAGATRQEIARILEKAAPLFQRLRAANEALHEKIRACLRA
jgi:hypothetical protein